MELEFFTMSVMLIFSFFLLLSKLLYGGTIQGVSEVSGRDKRDRGWKGKNSLWSHTIHNLDWELIHLGTFAW